MRRSVLRAIVLMPESVGIAAFLVGGHGCWASRGVKWVDTRGFKRSKYQLFREGTDPGRPEEAYKVRLINREVSLSNIILIYKLI